MNSQAVSSLQENSMQNQSSYENDIHEIYGSNRLKSKDLSMNYDNQVNNQQQNIDNQKALQQPQYSNVQPPQIMDQSKVQVVKTSNFDFNKIRKNQRRKNAKAMGSQDQTANNVKTMNKVDLMNNNRATSMQSKYRANVAELLNSNCERFEDYVRASSSQHQEEEILSRSLANSALTSSRLQRQEFNSKLKKAHVTAVESLNELATHNQNNPQSTGSLYPLIQKVPEEEGDESPLKALQIARRQSILKQRGMQTRRESFFGPTHMLTPDPLQKLLQTKKYLKDTQSALQTERLHSRRDSQGQNNSSNGTFKNEMLQKTLNFNNNEEKEVIQFHRNKTPDLSKTVDISKQQLKYRDRLFLKNLEQSNYPLSTTYAYQQEEAGLSLVLPELGKSKQAMINDTVQQALVLDHLNDYNKEAGKYNSLLIHLGVLLKKSISSSEQGHQLPCYFLTTMCCQILDKISLFFPQFNKILVPLKNTLFQSIYYQYDYKKHFKEDEQEIESNKNNVDLTKKNPRIQVKYLKYETYHDKYNTLLKENKELKREIMRIKREFHHEEKSSKIIKNLAFKFQKLRQRDFVRKVFTVLRFHQKQKYQSMFTQVIGNAISGSDFRGKITMRKFFAEWQIYTFESKFRKAKKEIEYYQNKIDDLDDNNSSQRVQIKELISENLKLKQQLNEKNHKLAMHENEMAQFQINEARKKPIQIKQCLKLYFKYIFTNPLITRLRIKRPLALFALNHQRVDENSQKQQKIDLTLLLKKKETIQEGGPGVNLLFSLSLRDIMIRWVNFMIEKAIVKLNPIIEILQREVSAKKQHKQKLRQKALKQDLDGEGISDSESEEEVKEEKVDYDEYQMVQIGLQETNKEIYSNYEPFKKYNQDLRLLMTFKSMISKVVNDFQLNLIQDGVLLAILFTIDSTERSIEISSSLQTSNTPSAKGGNTNQQKTYQYNENLVEEVVMPDYHNILIYVNDTNLQNRARLIMQQIEGVLHQKFDWYFSLQEFLIGREQTYTTVLLHLFYYYSNMEPSAKSQQSQRMRSSFSAQVSQNEQKLNLQVFKKILYLSRQKIMPLLIRKVHSHLQDVSLLFTKEELEKEESTALQLILELPYMSTKEIMIRWTNHLLRSYQEIKLQHELEQRFRARFVQASQEEQTATTQANSPNRVTRGGISIAGAQLQLNPSDGAKKSSTPVRKKANQIQNEKDNNQKQSIFRIGKDTKTQTIMREYKIGSNIDLAFEITKLKSLKEESYHRFILILAYLSPETMWDMHDLDYKDLKRAQNYIDVVENFVIKATLDQKHLFIMNAVTRITKKNNLISMNDLYSRDVQFEDLLIELFLCRPSLSNSRHHSVFIQSLQTIEDFYNSQKLYLKNFDKEKYDKIEDHIQKLKDEKEEITEAFAFIQDCDRIYLSIKELLLINKVNFPNPNQIIAKQMKIHERSEILLSDIEKTILNLNKSYLFQLLTFRQAQQGSQWSQLLEDVIKKYLYPIRRYLNVYMDSEGFISYFDMWRAIKSLNIRTFNLDCREVETILIKLIKLKDTRAQASKKNLGISPNKSIDNQDDLNLFDGINGNQEDQDAEVFMRKIKSEIQYQVFSSKRVGSSQRFRTKSSIVKEIEESLENAYIKTQLYRAKFNASDLILILIAILFKQNPSEFVSELTKISPLLQEEGMKNVNKLLSKDKQLIHVEAYLTEYAPNLLFEQFLIHNVFIKSEFTKKHPFRFNMMKDDFKSFLDHYLNSLFAVFDFYLHEFSQQYPQNIKYKHFCIQIEAVYGLLRDFNAFNPESGLTKNSFKKILTNIQKQVANEQKQISNIGKPSIEATIIASLTPTGRNSQPSASRSPFNKSQQTYPQQNQPATSEISSITEGFNSLILFEFMELLYLVSQYYQPDPFVNPNQKFADFLERVVFVNIQFKIKSKRLQDSPHKAQLIRSLENHKVIRGASLETFNSYFDLH